MWYFCWYRDWGRAGWCWRWPCYQSERSDQQTLWDWKTLDQLSPCIYCSEDTDLFWKNNQPVREASTHSPAYSSLGRSWPSPDPMSTWKIHWECKWSQSPPSPLSAGEICTCDHGNQKVEEVWWGNRQPLRWEPACWWCNRAILYCRTWGQCRNRSEPEVDVV